LKKILAKPDSPLLHTVYLHSVIFSLKENVLTSHNKYSQLIMEIQISYCLQENLRPLVSDWLTIVKNMAEMKGAEEIWTHKK
jgi:hypothetical protein